MQYSVDDTTGAGWTHVEVIGDGDDNCLNNIPLGFTYSGFGATTSTVSLSDNGVLFLGQGCSTAHTNSTLPSSLSTNPALFFFWDDLRDFGGGEYTRYATLGSAGGRVFNLFFRMRSFDTNCTDVIEVMVSVHESSGLVKATYPEVPTCNQMKGVSATFGFQEAGGGGANAFTVGVDSILLDDNNPAEVPQSMSFHPPN